MSNERTLKKNKVSQFILRIDFSPSSDLDYNKLAQSLRANYQLYKTELHTNYNVNVNTTEIKKEDYVCHVLENAHALSLRIDAFERNVCFTSLQYSDNSIYKEHVEELILAIKEQKRDFSSVRIGMRFINKFTCATKNEINKILCSADAKAIKDSLDRRCIARCMMVHEFQNNSHRIKVQYGVPNKFYPSVITNIDLVLDIDVFAIGLLAIDEWTEVIRECNHSAYDTFCKYIKTSYIESMM